MTELRQEDKRRLRKIENKHHSKWSIDEWVLKHYALYGKNDAFKSPMELWLQVITEGSQLAENVRRGRVKKAVDENIPKIFGWLIAFVGKYLHQPSFDSTDPIGENLRKDLRSRKNIPGPESFAKWILQKYPGVCCACGHRRCICSSHRKVFEGRKEKGYEGELAKLLTDGKKFQKEAFHKYKKIERERQKFYALPLDRLIDEFIFIYGGGHEGVDVWQIVAHLLEEIGEVAYEIDVLVGLHRLQIPKAAGASKIMFGDVIEKAYRRMGSPSKLRKDKESMKRGSERQIAKRLRSHSIHSLREELADVFSWVSAFLYKVGDIMREVREEEKEWYSFADWLGGKYFRRKSFVCFACGMNPCDEDCRPVWFAEKTLRDIGKERGYSL